VNLLSKICRTIVQVYPFLAAGKSVVFHTKFGACIDLVLVYSVDNISTYHGLDNISKVIACRNE
jgi:hypothetical protein